MGLFSFLFKPFKSEFNNEMNRLVDELGRIANEDDFLSERPGGPFDRECRHIRTREIGERIYAIGGAAAMEWVIKKISKKFGTNMGAHLEACWARIGDF